MKLDKAMAGRWALEAAGMFVAASGVSVITQTQLGTTPISAVPYVISRITGQSFGTVAFVFNVLLVLLQWALLRRHFRFATFLQIPVVFVFSAFIDLTMMMFSFLDGLPYWGRLAVSFFGNFVLAAGVVLQLQSRTIVQPGEGVVIALTVCLRKAFGTLKIWNDVALVVLAGLIGLACTGGIIGLREGTLISAFFVGFFAKQMLKVWPLRRS